VKHPSHHTAQFNSKYFHRIGCRVVSARNSKTTADCYKVLRRSMPKDKRHSRCSLTALSTCNRCTDTILRFQKKRYLALRLPGRNIFQTKTTGKKEREVLCPQSCTIFPKIQEPPQNSRRQIKFHTDHPQISGATGQSLVAMATWCPGLVHPCLCIHLTLSE
jgi:hypothetical protein